MTNNFDIKALIAEQTARSPISIKWDVIEKIQAECGEVATTYGTSSLPEEKNHVDEKFMQALVNGDFLTSASLAS